MQRLNRLRSEPRTSSTVAFNRDNQPEATKLVWLPIKGTAVDLKQLLIQIETAAAEMFQTETSKKSSWPLDRDAIFRKILDDMAKEKFEAANDSDTSIENNNANAAKADIKE